MRLRNLLLPLSAALALSCQSEPRQPSASPPAAVQPTPAAAPEAKAATGVAAPPLDAGAPSVVDVGTPSAATAPAIDAGAPSGMPSAAPDTAAGDAALAVEPVAPAPQAPGPIIAIPRPGTAVDGSTVPAAPVLAQAPTPDDKDLGAPTFRLVHSVNVQGELDPCG